MINIQSNVPMRHLMSKSRDACPAKFALICMFSEFTAEKTGISQAFNMKSSVSIFSSSFLILKERKARNASCIPLEILIGFLFLAGFLVFFSLFLISVFLRNGWYVKGMNKTHILK